jgi:hypothetical protein
MVPDDAVAHGMCTDTYSSRRVEASRLEPVAEQVRCIVCALVQHTMLAGGALWLHSVCMHFVASPVPEVPWSNFGRGTELTSWHRTRSEIAAALLLQYQKVSWLMHI